MIENMTQQLLQRIARLEDKISRLVSRDTADVTEWTSWTPELYGSTTAGTITYTTQFGSYAVVNDIVFIIGRITVNTITVAPTGNLRIRTLPLAPPNIINNPNIPMFGRANLSAGYTAIGGNLRANIAEIDLTQTGDELLQAYPAANLTTSFDVRFEGFYRPQ